MEPKTKCGKCNTVLKPVIYLEEEKKINGIYFYKTGRTRMACDYLVCPNCGKKKCVDSDYPAEPWKRF